jgi:DNA-directed RNA polymerase specialized sigma24 family protein
MELANLEFTLAITDDSAQRINVDYKDVLNEIGEAMKFRAEIDISKIRALNDPRQRATAAMLYGGVSVQEIAVIMNLSVSQVYRNIQFAGGR